jgi:hypothetical protein
MSISVPAEVIAKCRQYGSPRVIIVESGDMDKLHDMTPAERVAYIKANRGHAVPLDQLTPMLELNQMVLL